jgi:hydroxymethylglutaryl-CoA lyase
MRKMLWPKKVQIKEVGPRDGLQNEKKVLSTKDKIHLINELSTTGLDYIEITSFVHPKWIPTLADAKEVAKGIKRVNGVTYAALVPNMVGLTSALEANLDEISVFMSASETHNQKNINKSIRETLPILKEVVGHARSAKKSVRGYVSTVFGCPYEGRVSVDSVRRVAEELLEMGVYELSIGDTVGIANPKQVIEVLEVLLKDCSPKQIALHFHDTRGLALANIVVALEMGVLHFDSSVGGLGGCPYAPGASGNVATEDLLYMLEGMGIQTGVKQDRILEAALLVQAKVDRPLPSHLLQTIYKSS